MRIYKIKDAEFSPYHWSLLSIFAANSFKRASPAWGRVRDLERAHHPLCTRAIHIFYSIYLFYIILFIEKFSISLRTARGGGVPGLVFPSPRGEEQPARGTAFPHPRPCPGLHRAVPALRPRPRDRARAPETERTRNPERVCLCC